MVDIPAMVLNATLDEQDDTRVFVMGRCSFHSSVTVWEVANTDPSSLDSGLFISELAQWLSHLPRGRPQQMSWCGLPVSAASMASAHVPEWKYISSFWCIVQSSTIRKLRKGLICRWLSPVQYVWHSLSASSSCMLIPNNSGRYKSLSCYTIGTSFEWMTRHRSTFTAQNKCPYGCVYRLEAFFNWKGWVWLIWVPTISIYFCFHCGMCDTCYFNKRWRQPHEDSALLSQYGTIPTSEAPVEHMPDEKSNSIMSSGDVGQEVSCIREGSSVSEVVIAKPWRIAMHKGNCWLSSLATYSHTAGDVQCDPIENGVKTLGA